MTLIKKPADLIVQQTVKSLLYGQPGLGKTTLGLSAPQPLLLDFDHGVHRVNPNHQTDTVQISSWEDVINVLKEDLSAYKTMVFDTAGKMLDYMAAYLIKQDPKLAKKDGSLSLQGYGARKAMFLQFLHTIDTLGKNAIFISHDREEKDGDDRFVRPEIGGSSGNDLIKDLDLVGYMEAVGKKRTISFDPQQKFYGKNTANLPGVIELPDVVEGGKANVLMTDIFTKYGEAMEKRKAVAAEYSALMDQINTTISEAENADQVNAAIEKVKDLKHIWDTKLQASILLAAKAKSLGLKFNRSSGVYEVVDDNKIPAGENPSGEVKPEDQKPDDAVPQDATPDKPKKKVYQRKKPPVVQPSLINEDESSTDISQQLKAENE